ncbi:MAG: AEC family transporter [Erysipelotrichaceae bacterium]
MEIAITLFIQIIKMFLMMSVGYAIYSYKWVNEETSKGLSTILLKVVSPCIVFKSFLITLSQEIMINMLVCLGLSVVATLTGFILAALFFDKNQRINRFAIGFSNVGFMGIPLVEALLGSEYILYLSIYIVVFNLSLWSYGVFLMSDNRKEMAFKKVLMNPNVLAVIAGMIFMIIGIGLPTMLTDVLSSFATINTPLAMMVLGMYIAKESLISIFNQPIIYKVVLMRLILTPLIVVSLFSIIPESFHSIKLVALIAAATPTASSCAMLAQLYDQDFTYAAQVVSLTTILCLFTMPIMIGLTGLFW